jgi:predicted acylesterase/phospholipase RssA
LPGAATRGISLTAFTAHVEQHVDIAAAGGTSAGALEAAALAIGMTGDERLRMWRRVFKRGDRLLDGGIGRLMGAAFMGVVALHRGEELRRILREVFGERCLGDVAIPLRITAADLDQRAVVVFDSRRHADVSLVNALYASSAVEFFFDPIEVRETNARRFADAGPGANVPAGLWDDRPETTLVVRFEGQQEPRTVERLMEGADAIPATQDDAFRPARGIAKYAAAVFDIVMDASASALPSRKPDTEWAVIRGEADGFDFTLTSDDLDVRESHGLDAAQVYLARVRRGH